MSSSFQWDQFESLPSQASSPQQSPVAFDWEQFEALPQYDAQEANQEKEGAWKAAARDVLQIPKGLANLTLPGMLGNLWSVLGAGESLNALQEDFSPERLQELKQKFPNAPWEKFDEENFRTSYLKGLEGAQKSIPTVENISRGIESATGLPLESKTLSNELVQFVTGGFGPALTAKLTAQPSKFAGVLNKIKNLRVKDKSAASLVQNQLAKEMTQAEIITEGRRLGFSDKELAPLLNSEGKTKLLSKLAPKGGRAQKVLGKTKERLEGIYEGLKTSKGAEMPLEASAQKSVLQNLQKELRDLPDVARQGILKDTELLLKDPHLNGNNLINYWQKINATIRSNPAQYGSLSKIKKVVGKGIENASPELAKDFQVANQLYSRYAKISSALKPSIVDKFITAGESLGTLYSLVSGDVASLTKIAGESAIRRLSREMLINPKFQQIGSKLVNALNKNKTALAAKLVEDLSKEVRDISPELADNLSKINWDQLDLSQEEG